MAISIRLAAFLKAFFSKRARAIFFVVSFDRSPGNVLLAKRDISNVPTLSTE